MHNDNCQRNTAKQRSKSVHASAALTLVVILHTWFVIVRSFMANNKSLSKYSNYTKILSLLLIVTKSWVHHRYYLYYRWNMGWLWLLWPWRKCCFQPIICLLGPWTFWRPNNEPCGILLEVSRLSHSYLKWYTDLKWASS